MNNRAAYNPYSRLPVNEQAMFFGRTRESEQILGWLRAGAGNIWLLGQKRVGKTSLLFHLKHHFLPEWGYVAAFVDFQLLGNLASGNLCYEIAAAIFADLQGDPLLGESGAPLFAPLRTLFDLQPAVELIAYLRAVNSHIQGAGRRTRLVILLDEFSRTTDAYLQGKIDRSFFELWRGVMQATAPEISYITVVQQQTYNTVSRRAGQNLDDPSWHIMELGEKLVLRPLDQEAVCRLIEWPMRNFVEFGPESVAAVAALTGGNPFLIQAFCFKLAAHMADQDRRRVERADIEAVRMEFMQPTESVFAHFLDMLRGIGNQVCQTVATLAEGQAAEAQPRVTWAQIAAAQPGLPEPALRRALQELATCDILIEVAPDAWTFSSRLFQQWLALNAE